MKTFKTPKGTELPLMDLKGKDYLQVAHRVQWFREEHPDGKIETEIVSNDGKLVLIKASVFARVKTGNVSLPGSLHTPPTEGHIYDIRLLATAHKLDQLGQDMLEKCETGAIGRALALCGYGTQFAEINEGDRLSDAPVQPVYQRAQGDLVVNNLMKKQVQNHAPQSSSNKPTSGIYVIPIGKFKDREMDSIPRQELQNYVNFIKRKASEDGKPIGGKMKEFIERFEDSQETSDFLDSVANPYQNDGPPLSSYDPNEDRIPF